MPDTLLTVPFEREADPKWGGACAIRTTLNCSTIDAKNAESQQAIYAYAHGHNDTSEPIAWDIDPKGLKDTLNAKDPRGPGLFVEYTFADRPSADGKLKYTIDAYKVPPSAVISGREWIVVIGYRTDDTGKLEAFRAQEPTQTSPGPRWYYTVAEWDRIFKPVDVGTRWKGQFATVCDPLPEGDPVTWAERRVKRDGERLLSPAEAVDLAREGILEQGLDETPEFIRAVQEGRPGEPLLVQAVQEEDQYYYVVPFLAERETALGVVLVDARFGDLRSASAHDEPLPFRIRTPEEVLELVTSGRDVVGDRIVQARDRLMQGIAAWSRRGGAEPYTDWRELRQLVEQQLVEVREPLTRRHFRRETTQVATVLAWSPLLPEASLTNPYYVVTSGAFRVYVKARVVQSDSYTILEAIDIPYSAPGN